MPTKGEDCEKLIKVQNNQKELRFFNRYNGIDYSGAGTPNSRQGGLQVFDAKGSEKPKKISTDDGKGWNWTRKKIAYWWAGSVFCDMLGVKCPKMKEEHNA